MRQVLVAAVAAFALFASSLPAAAGSPQSPPVNSRAPISTVSVVSADHGGAGTQSAAVSVTGAVADPASYTPADLVALPQTTLPLLGPRGQQSGTVSGVSLEDLVGRSTPEFGAGKNALLRGSVTVVAAHGLRVTFAVGELDAGFGNHPALLTVRGAGSRAGIDLVVPGDRTRLRSLSGVTSISVAVSDAGFVAPSSPGGVRLIVGHRTVWLPGGLLSRLPQRTMNVSFLSGSNPQTHTETGPSLGLVLLLAGVLPLPDTVVTAVGSDGYGASVTLGEDLLGGRPLLLSLIEDGEQLDQPRLVAVGDVKGGRYVSGVAVLAVQR